MAWFTKRCFFLEDFPFSGSWHVYSILLYVDDVVAAATMLNELGIFASDGIPILDISYIHLMAIQMLTRTK